MEELFVLSAVGEDRPGLVKAISRVILENKGNIKDSRMAVLGGEFAVITLVSADAESIKKLTAALPGLEEELGLSIKIKPTRTRGEKSWAPYEVDVVAMDHPGIVHEVTEFFSSRNINIETLETKTYAAPHTGTRMFALSMVVGVPADVKLTALRQAFMEFCDGLNVDGALESQR